MSSKDSRNPRHSHAKESALARVLCGLCAMLFVFVPPLSVLTHEHQRMELMEGPFTLQVEALGLYLGCVLLGLLFAYVAYSGSVPAVLAKWFKH